MHFKRGIRTALERRDRMKAFSREKIKGSLGRRRDKIKDGKGERVADKKEKKSERIS